MSNMLQELTTEEMEQVNGGFVANAAGAGVGGFYSSLILGGNSATGSDLFYGTLAGAAGGFFNPISSGAGFASAIGAGAASGSVLWFKGTYEQAQK